MCTSTDVEMCLLLIGMLRKNYKKKSKKKGASTHAILTPGNKSLTAVSLNGMNCTGCMPVDGMVDGITNSMDMNLGKLGDSEGQGSLARCNPWHCDESDLT